MKDCFTRYSTQSIAVVVLALALIVRFQLESMFVTMALLPVILLLSVIGRMGTHKYSAASRLLGYELHLERTNRLSNDSRYEWRKEWGDIGWEEAMRAYRVVQATVYQHVYVGPKDSEKLKTLMSPNTIIDRFVFLLPKFIYWRWHQDTFRPQFMEKLRNTNRSLWFEPQSLFAAENAAYYPGGYLTTMLRVVQGGIIICLFFFFWSPFLSYMRAEDRFIATTGLLLYIPVIVMVFGFCVLQGRQLYRRLDVIDNGMLSIHSSGILWHAVIVSHFRAIETLEKDVNGIVDYEGYTKSLSIQATDLAENIIDIHDWMMPNRGKLEPGPNVLQDVVRE